MCHRVCDTVCVCVCACVCAWDSSFCRGAMAPTGVERWGRHDGGQAATVALSGMELLRVTTSGGGRRASRWMLSAYSNDEDAKPGSGGTWSVKQGRERDSEREGERARGRGR